MRRQVEVGRPLAVATSPRRMPLRPREATTRSMPTTRSMLWVPRRAAPAGLAVLIARPHPQAVATMRQNFGFDLYADAADSSCNAR